VRERLWIAGPKMKVWPFFVQRVDIAGERRSTRWPRSAIAVSANQMGSGDLGVGDWRFGVLRINPSKPFEPVLPLQTETIPAPSTACRHSTQPSRRPLSAPPARPAGPPLTNPDPRGGARSGSLDQPFSVGATSPAVAPGIDLSAPTIAGGWLAAMAGPTILPNRRSSR